LHNLRLGCTSLFAAIRPTNFYFMNGNLPMPKNQCTLHYQCCYLSTCLQELHPPKTYKLHIHLHIFYFCRHCRYFSARD